MWRAGDSTSEFLKIAVAAFWSPSYSFYKWVNDSPPKLHSHLPPILPQLPLSLGLLSMPDRLITVPVRGFNLNSFPLLGFIPFPNPIGFVLLECPLGVNLFCLANF